MTHHGALAWADPAAAEAFLGRARCAARRAAGEPLRLDDDDLTAISDHLRRTPSQERSRAKVALILQTAETLHDHGHQLTATFLADCADVSIGSFYQFFRDVDAVMRCMATLAMRRATAELQRSSASGLAHVLTRHLTEYRRQPLWARRDVRAQHGPHMQGWRQELADTLQTLSAFPASAASTSDAPTRQPLVEQEYGASVGEVAGLVTVALADRAAALTVRGGAGTDRVACELTRAAQLYIDAVGLTAPHAPATPHEAPRPGLPRRDRCTLRRASDHARPHVEMARCGQSAQRREEWAP